MLKSAVTLVEVILGIIVELFKSLIRYALIAAALFATLITLAILVIVNLVR